MKTQSLEHFTEQVGKTARGIPIYRVKVPHPPFSNKGYMIERKGIYIFEKTPGMLNTVACMHFGEGQIRVLDGVVKNNVIDEDNSRPLYIATTQTMCLWMYGAGFEKGLIVEAIGTDLAQPVFMSLSWSVPQSKEK